MLQVDVEIVCQICQEWSAVGTIGVDTVEAVPALVFKLVQQKVMQHTVHGGAGQFQITYRPR